MDINEGPIVDPAQRALAREAAELLMPDPPPQLIGAVENIAEEAREAEQRCENSASRSETRRVLSKIAEHARGLAALLNDPAVAEIRNFLAGSGNKPAITSHRMLWMAENSELLMDQLFAGTGGRNATVDVLGAPRGRLICAVGALKLSRLVLNRRPGKNDEAVQELAAAIWHVAAHGSPDDTGEPDAGADRWERHLRNALQAFAEPRKEATAPAFARLAVGHAIKVSGLLEFIGVEQWQGGTQSAPKCG